MNMRLALLLTTLLAVAFLGCEVEEDEISPPPEEIEERDPADVADEGGVVDNARVRVAPEGGTSAAFMTLRNTSAEADTLVAVRTEVAEAVEIHESSEEDGMMGMQELDQLPIEGNAEVILEPGGYHLMLLGLTRTLEVGEEIDLELEFAREGAQTHSVPVHDITE